MSKYSIIPFAILIAAAVSATTATTASAAGLTIPVGSKVDVNPGTLNVAGDETFSGTLEASTGTIKTWCLALR